MSDAAVAPARAASCGSSGPGCAFSRPLSATPRLSAYDSSCTRSGCGNQANCTKEANELSGEASCQFESRAGPLEVHMFELPRGASLGGTAALPENTVASTAFEFRLPPDLTLRLTPENTTLARDVAFASGIHSMDPTRLCSVIESLANPRRVAKPHLLALFSSRPQNVIECISECYDALQRRGHAPMDELMTALSILCSCTKSDKLAAAFEVFDPQGARGASVSRFCA